MLQSKPVDPGNVANKSASFKNEKIFFDNGQLDNSKIEKMDTGIITDDEILYIYIYIYILQIILSSVTLAFEFSIHILY